MHVVSGQDDDFDLFSPSHKFVVGLYGLEDGIDV